LWDVPYERLAGRAVVATGDRFRDLSVRLHYGGVRHTAEPDPVRAVTLAAATMTAAPAATDTPAAPAAPAATDGDPGAVVDVIGNYTAFHDLLGAPA
jgi:hypothetical protein